MTRLGWLFLALYLLLGIVQSVHAASTWTLVLETWPTTGHGLPGTQDIERILVPGFPDAESCRRYGQLAQAAYPAPTDKHFTRRLLACGCQLSDTK